MAYENLTPEQRRQLNELLSQTTIRSDGNNIDIASDGVGGPINRQISDLIGVQPESVQQPVQQMPKNYIKSSSGNVIDMGYAVAGASRPGDISPVTGAPMKHNVWADGPEILARRQLASGKTAIDKRVPAYDSEGRQSDEVITEVLTPDYLNPAKLKELQYRKALAELQPKPEKAPDAVRTQQWAMGMYDQMPEGKMKQAFGKKYGLVGDEDKEALKSEQAKTSMAKDLTSFEAAMSDVVGGATTPSAQKKAVAPAVGWFDTLMPDWGEDKANAAAKIERLKEMAQVIGLKELRASGVAPGSVTEREWPKFQAMLGNINRSMSEDEFVKSLANIRAKIAEFKTDVGGGASQGSLPTPGTRKSGYIFIGGNPADKNSWKKE